MMKFWKIDEFDPGKAYFFNNICFDPRDGSGATPNTSNISYMGAVVFIEPELFLKLALPLGGHDRGGIEFWQDRLPKKDWCISPPSLSLTEADHLGFYVSSHEGRHRTTALKKIGLPLMPVYLFPPTEVRARHLNDEFFDKISTLFSEDTKAAVHFRPEYTILDHNVFVRATNERIANHLAGKWQAIKPTYVETVAQKTPHPKHPEHNYYWSKPKES